MSDDFLGKCIHLLYFTYNLNRNMFNRGTLCLQDSLDRNMFTQHMLSNSSTSWMFQKYWMHTTQYTFVLCAVNLTFVHVPDSCKVTQPRGSTTSPEQPCHTSPSLGQCPSDIPGTVLYHLTRTQATTANSGLSSTPGPIHVPCPTNCPADSQAPGSFPSASQTLNGSQQAQTIPVSVHGFSWLPSQWVPSHETITLSPPSTSQALATWLTNSLTGSWAQALSCILKEHALNPWQMR